MLTPIFTHHNRWPSVSPAAILMAWNQQQLADMQCKQMTYYASRWHTRQVRHKLTTYHLLACWLKSIRYHHPQWSWQVEVDVCLAQAHWGSPHTWPSGTRPHRKVSPVSTLSAQKQQHWEEYDWSLWETRNHSTKYMLMNNRKDIANIKLSQVLVNQVKSYSSTLATFVCIYTDPMWSRS